MEHFTLQVVEMFCKNAIRVWALEFWGAREK